MATIQYGLITTVTTDSSMKLRVSINKNQIVVTGMHARRKAKYSMPTWSEIERQMLIAIEKG